MDAEWQAARDVIDKRDGRALIAGIVDLEHANPTARARNALEKLDVDVQRDRRAAPFRTAFSGRMPPALLIGRLGDASNVRCAPIATMAA